jgi:hypothetical protein
MRSMRLAALTVAMTLAFSGLALARDHDDDRYKHDHYGDKHEDRNHDWAHGHDNDHSWNRDHDRNNDRWRESERERVREHERWEREHRNDGYYGGQVYNRNPRGYPGSGSVYPGGSYGYPGSVYGRGGYGNGGGIGFNQGRMEGENQARKDMAQGKPFNPNPRGSNHTDNGYHSYMGDKNQYRASYTEGYRSGYESNFGGGRGRGWGY